MTYDQVERLLELTASAVNEIGNLAIETKRHNTAMERLVASMADVDDNDLEAFYRKPAVSDTDLQHANEAYMSKHTNGFTIPPVPNLSTIENALIRSEALKRPSALPVVRWVVCDDAGNHIGIVRARSLDHAREQVMMAYGLTADIAGRLD